MTSALGSEEELNAISGVSCPATEGLHRVLQARLPLLDVVADPASPTATPSAVEAANNALDRLERDDPAPYDKLLRDRRSNK